jgi:hypothetical protein
MTEKNLPEEAFENKPIQIKMGEQEFNFKEPGHRACRRMARKYMEVYDCHSVLFDKMNALENSADLGPGEQAELFGVIEECQDLIYEALSLNEHQQRKADDEATMQDIMTAFTDITAVVCRPFVGGRPDTAPEKMDQQTEDSESGKTPTS